MRLPLQFLDGRDSFVSLLLENDDKSAELAVLVDRDVKEVAEEGGGFLFVGGDGKFGRVGGRRVSRTGREGGLEVNGGRRERGGDKGGS